MIREWIGRKAEKEDWPNPPWPMPPKQSGAQIENVQGMDIPIVDLLEQVIDPPACIRADRPTNIENLDQEYPLSLYTTTLNQSGNVLEIPGLADHGYIYLDSTFQGNLTNVFSGRFTKKLALDGLNGTAGQKLDIIVEHVGRLLFPLAQLDHKGILSEVLLDGQPVGAKWRLCGIDVHKLNKAAQNKMAQIKATTPNFEDNNLLVKKMKRDSVQQKGKPAGGGPSIYAAQFTFDEAELAKAKEGGRNGMEGAVLPYTFFDTRGWGHGILVVNDFVVGRYWPVIGPQMSLFVPGSVMRPRDNFVALIELSGREKEDTKMAFVPQAIWEYPGQQKMAQPEVPRKRKNE